MLCQYKCSCVEDAEKGKEKEIRLNSFHPLQSLTCTEEEK